VSKRRFLNRIPDFDLGLARLPLLPIAIKSGSAHTRKLTHSLDTCFALRGH
jgi:hypothetical protein